MGTTVNIDLALRASQLGANQLAVHDGAVVQSVGDELRKWNARTMQPDGGWTMVPRHFCFAQDGSLVAYSLPPNSPEAAVFRVGKSGIVETFRGPVSVPTPTNVVLRGRASDELYVTEKDRLVRLQLVDDRADELAGFAHPSPNAQNRDQLFSLGDGRVVAPDREGGIRVVDTNSSVAYQMPGRHAMHLAAASGERFWYSYAAKESWSFNMLALAKLATPMEAKLIDFSPARVVHLASSSDAVVVLLATLRGVGVVQWNVAVVDESGTERWRANVPKELDASAAGFVAISEQRVVLANHSHGLIAWDASKGALVTA